MIKVGILTISDKGSRGGREDSSGKIIMEMVGSIGGEIAKYEIIPDEKNLIEDRLHLYADELKLDLILTTGGTGLGPRDVTPEATLAVIDKEVPGIGEAMRAKGFEATPTAILSRAIAGIRKQSLIVNLPGSPKGVKESLEVILSILPHAIDILKGKLTEHNSNWGLT